MASLFLGKAGITIAYLCTDSVDIQMDYTSHTIYKQLHQDPWNLNEQQRPNISVIKILFYAYFVYHFFSVVYTTSRFCASNTSRWTPFTFLTLDFSEDDTYFLETLIFKCKPGILMKLPCTRKVWVKWKYYFIQMRLKDLAVNWIRQNHQSMPSYYYSNMYFLFFVWHWPGYRLSFGTLCLR